MRYKLQRWQSEVFISLGKRRQDIQTTLLDPLEEAVQKTIRTYVAIEELPDDVTFIAQQEGLDVYLVALPKPAQAAAEKPQEPETAGNAGDPAAQEREAEEEPAA